MAAGLISGLEAALANIAELSQKLQNKGIRRGLTKAVRMQAKAVKAAMTHRPGPGDLLRKSIAGKVRTGKNNVIVGSVGAKKGIRAVVGTYTRGKHKGEPKYQVPSRIFHLVEKGHAKGGGRSAARAYPSLGPAGASTRDETLSVITAELELEVANFKANK